MRISNHFHLRMKERGITVTQIEKALSEGAKLKHRTDASKTVYRTDEVYVVVGMNNTLITTFKNERRA